MLRGVGNIIGKNVKIYNNVIIGNNNRIYDNTILYPNTIIGNNNIILNGNIIGEHPVNSNEDISSNFNKNFEKGVKIGNNNMFHVNNLIFGGIENPTTIGNFNKLLAENHIGHDTNIENHVIIYPRCITGGHSIIKSDSSMGFYSTIQQRKKLGNYAMIGAGNNASKDVFPFFIQVNNKYLRLNTHRIPKHLQIKLYEEELRRLAGEYKKNEIFILPNSLDIPINIQNYIKKFIKD